MSIANEPMRGHHGVLLYSAQTTKGTAVTPASAVGLATVDVDFDVAQQSLYALGSATAQFFKPGIAKSTFNISIDGVQDLTFISKVARTAGVCPWITLGVGVTPDGGTNDSKQIVDCKINTLQLSLEAGGLLKATVGGTGGLATAITTLAPVYLTPTPFMSYEAVLTKGGTAYEAQSISISIDNDIKVEPVINGAAPSTFKRGWKYQTEGKLSVSGEFTRFAKSGVDMHADTFTDFSIVLAFTDIAGGGTPNAITISLANAVLDSEKVSMSPDGDVMYTTPFRAKSFTIA